MVITVYITWWFLTFFDNFFSVRSTSSLHSTDRDLLHDAVSAHLPCPPSMRAWCPVADALCPLQPVYEALFGFHVFGLGFVTSMGFIIGTGAICPSFRGLVPLTVTQSLLDRMKGPPVSGFAVFHDRCLCVILAWRAAAASGRLGHQEATPHQACVFSSKTGMCCCSMGYAAHVTVIKDCASVWEENHACDMLQVSGAVNPANESTASFRECVLIRHPRHGEYAFAFITGTTVLQVSNPQRCAEPLVSICERVQVAGMRV
jgi:uncharacterized membrane protein